MIHLSENIWGVDSVTLLSRFVVAEDPATTRPYFGTIEVTYSGPVLLDPAEYEGWLADRSKLAYAPAAFLREVFDRLCTDLAPAHLLVTLSCDQLGYGTQILRKEHHT